MSHESFQNLAKNSATVIGPWNDWTDQVIAVPGGFTFHYHCVWPLGFQLGALFIYNMAI